MESGIGVVVIVNIRIGVGIGVGIGVVSELTSPATTVSMMGMTPIVIASTTAPALTTTLSTTPASTATPRCTVVGTQVRS